MDSSSVPDGMKKAAVKIQLQVFVKWMFHFLREIARHVLDWSCNIYVCKYMLIANGYTILLLTSGVREFKLLKILAHPWYIKVFNLSHFTRWTFVSYCGFYLYFLECILNHIFFSLRNVKF